MLVIINFPEVATTVFSWRVFNLLKIGSQKSCKIFCETICRQHLAKIVQSGHTDWPLRMGIGNHNGLQWYKQFSHKQEFFENLFQVEQMFL